MRRGEKSQQTARKHLRRSPLISSSTLKDSFKMAPLAMQRDVFVLLWSWPALSQWLFLIEMMIKNAVYLQITGASM